MVAIALLIHASTRRSIDSPSVGRCPPTRANYQCGEESIDFGLKGYRLKDLRFWWEPKSPSQSSFPPYPFAFPLFPRRRRFNGWLLHSFFLLILPASNPKYESHYGCGDNVPCRKVFNRNCSLSYSLSARLARNPL